MHDSDEIPFPVPSWCKSCQAITMAVKLTRDMLTRFVQRLFMSLKHALIKRVFDE